MNIRDKEFSSTLPGTAVSRRAVLIALDKGRQPKRKNQRREDLKTIAWTVLICTLLFLSMQYVMVSTPPGPHDQAYLKKIMEARNDHKAPVERIPYQIAGAGHQGVSR